jgi:hypothetical protein
MGVSWWSGGDYVNVCFALEDGVEARCWLVSIPIVILAGDLVVRQGRVILRQCGPGMRTLSPSSQTAWTILSIASVAPAVRTICSGFTAWIG